MKADDFYRTFDAGLTATPLPAGMKRLAGRGSKWKIPLAEGHLALAFATNARVAGLADHWPGEFRPRLRWTAGAGRDAPARDVSLFQYTLPAENDAHVQLQRQAVAKFFAATHADPGLRDLLDAGAAPVPNHDRWFYYFDADDAHAWGGWFGGALPGWLARFAAAPESLDDWCWRVLWPHLPREPR